jgi:ABC-2 type transport system ATP-binding protein/capsular polysaccharide transport system ATP-binding protein
MRCRIVHKRGDRAMLIISDTEYVRHHCGKFAVLNEGTLVSYPDFDQAIEAQP